MTLLRLTGHIAGFGSTAGARMVVGRWTMSPWGRFADVMVAHPDGHRLLLAPDAGVAELVASAYTFDDVHIVPVIVAADPGQRVWRLTAGPLDATITIGGRTPLGRILRAAPAGHRSGRLFAAAVDPVARLLLPGVRTSGSAGPGWHEWYAATDQHAIVAARSVWGDDDLGGLADVSPPVGFGFGSTPRAPSVTALTSHIRTPDGAADGSGRGPAGP
ncbi:hypothetical protein QUV83_04045 [Cellulomonas cellasea]|uniref:hypothetical protein n=1 Tax=Cellulomonas cellasea TaxID=43670 RepID=UPI0025A417AB|nr:hypothetical protein [Cellulomonas cellasea]MDM8083939.1 hypothetical protein [Cellulomonas cellasea]